LGKPDDPSFLLLPVKKIYFHLTIESERGKTIQEKYVANRIVGKPGGGNSELWKNPTKNSMRKQT